MPRDNRNQDKDLPKDSEEYDIEEDEIDQYQDPDERDRSGIRGGRMKQDENDLPETDEDMI